MSDEQQTPHVEVAEADEPPLCGCGHHYVTPGFGHPEWAQIQARP